MEREGSGCSVGGGGVRCEALSHSRHRVPNSYVCPLRLRSSYSYPLAGLVSPLFPDPDSFLTRIPRPLPFVGRPCAAIFRNPTRPYPYPGGHFEFTKRRTAHVCALRTTWNLALLVVVCGCGLRGEGRSDGRALSVKLINVYRAEGKPGKSKSKSGSGSSPARRGTKFEDKGSTASPTDNRQRDGGTAGKNNRMNKAKVRGHMQGAPAASPLPRAARSGSDGHISRIDRRTGHEVEVPQCVPTSTHHRPRAACLLA